MPVHVQRGSSIGVAKEPGHLGGGGRREVYGGRVVPKGSMKVSTGNNPVFRYRELATLAPLPPIPPAEQKKPKKDKSDPCTCLEEQIAKWSDLPPIDFSCHDCGGTPGLG